MMNSEIFVFLDDAQFTKKGWQNRNQIRTKDGMTLLSIPVHAHSYPKINEITIDNNKIGSSYIRKLLIDGKINKANQLLRKPFVISGAVMDGEKRGRKLGYPTANIEIYKSYPINGIFLVEVSIDDKDKHHGLASIGNKPTFLGKNDVLEVFIFDFDSDIYKKNLKVYFVEKIREQIKFKNENDLKTQMNEDYKKAIQILNKINGL